MLSTKFAGRLAQGRVRSDKASLWVVVMVPGGGLPHPPPLSTVACASLLLNRLCSTVKACATACCNCFSTSLSSACRVTFKARLSHIPFMWLQAGSWKKLNRISCTVSALRDSPVSALERVASISACKSLLSKGSSYNVSVGSSSKRGNAEITKRGD